MVFSQGSLFTTALLKNKWHESLDFFFSSLNKSFKTVSEYIHNPKAVQNHFILGNITKVFSKVVSNKLKTWKWKPLANENEGNQRQIKIKHVEKHFVLDSFGCNMYYKCSDAFI